MKFEDRYCLQCGKSFRWMTKNGVKDFSRGKYCCRDHYYMARRGSPTAELIARKKAKEFRALAKDYAMSRVAEFIGHDKAVIRKAADILGVTFPKRSIPNFQGGAIYRK